jgi:1,2-diacylglycerol 3-alpha-glucosyltransferase
MRIGLFTDSYYPQTNGVATSVFMLREHLARLGHEVFVFTSACPAARHSGDMVYRIPSVPIGAGLRLACAPFGIMKTVGELNLDMIHTHTEFSLGILGRAAARRYGLPLIHTMHTVYEAYTHYILGANRLDPLKKSAARRLCAAFCNSADTVIAPTRKVENLLRSYGVTRDVAVVPTGIDIGRFRAADGDAKKTVLLRKKLGITENCKVIVSIGRLSEEKSIDTILRAMKTYLPGRPDARLLIVGDGPARKSLECLTADLGIADKIIFAGEQPWDGIADFYRLGRAFVSASQSETQGLTYIEAFASGVPVVAKADPCLDGVLNDGANGFAFDDDAGMIRALDRLLFDELCRKKISARAILSAERFSAERFAEAVMSVYRGVKGIKPAEDEATPADGLRWVAI